MIMPRDLKRLPLPLAVCLITIATVTLLSLLMAVWRVRRHGVYLGFTGLWIPIYGNDFYCYLSRFPLRHSVKFFTAPGFGWYYPAPAIFVDYPFYRLANITGAATAYAVLVVTILGSGVLMGIVFARRLIREGLGVASAIVFCASVLLLSWPLYFAAQRGNIEGLTWLLVAAGIWFFCRGEMAASAVCLGVAASFKIYPFLFFALYLKRRCDWRWLLVGAGAAGVLSLLGLRFLEPDVVDSMKRTVLAIHNFTWVYGERGLQGPWDHSAFALVKNFTDGHHPNGHRELTLYYPLAAVAALVLALGAWRRPVTNQVLFLTCAAITLPPTSFDYTLCLLYVPFAMVVVLAVRSARTEIPVAGLTLALTLFGLALGPEIFAATEAHPSLPGAIKCCLLLALAVLSVTARLEMPQREEGLNEEKADFLLSY